MAARFVIALAALALAAAPARAADITSAGGLRLVPVLRGGAAFSEPVNVVAPPGDRLRLFVVERAGQVWLVRDGMRASRPFADLSAQVESSSGTENGLASIALAPDYAASGRLYAFFTDAGRCDAARPAGPARAPRSGPRACATPTGSRSTRRRTRSCSATSGATRARRSTCFPWRAHRRVTWAGRIARAK